jgi:signal transduction histidine kinase
MFEPGFLKWRYFKVLFLFHAVVLYFMTTPLSNVFSNLFQWTIVLLVSYAFMAIPFLIAMRIPWITADGRREFAALSIVGLVRGFGILDLGLLLDLPQVQPYLLRPLNSSVSVPLWFLIIRFIIGSKGEFQKLFHDLYVRNIRDKVTSVIPINGNLRESEIESIETQVRMTLEPLKKQIEEVSGIELDKESLKKESLIIQSFIEDRLRPLSHDLWRQQQINPPRLNYLNFLLRLLFTTKSQFGIAIFPAFIYVLVGLTTIIGFDFALRHSLLNLLLQVFIFLVFEFTYSRAKRLKNYLNIIAILLCAIIPAFLDEIFLGSIYSETIPAFVELIGVGWFLALSLAFSVAKAQTDYRKEIIGIILKDIEQPFFDNQEDKMQIAEKYAKYLHGDVQSTLSSSQMQLIQASENDDAELGKSAIEKMASVLRRDHYEYAIGEAISPVARFQQIIDAWDGIATISIDLDDQEIADSVLLKISDLLEELASNAIRHGQAKNIIVMIESNKSEVHITVTDDGKPRKPGKPGLGSSLLGTQALGFNVTTSPKGNVTTFKVMT